MNLRLNHFERAAIAFVMVATVGLILSLTGLASHNGWFERKMHCSTTLDTSEGIREGSPIEMSGVRIGSVTAVELTAENRVRLKLAILRKYGARLHADSHIEIFRPFVIGDKTLVINPGSPDQPALAENSELPSEEVLSLAELLNGRRLAPYLKTFADSLDVLKSIADILIKTERPRDVAKALSHLPALLISASEMSSQVGHLAKQLGRDDQLPRVIAGLGEVTDGLRNTPALGRDVGTLVTNLARLTGELSQLAPELPKSSRRVGEALDEAVVVLKAMQKTFLLSSSVREVKQEEAAEKAREPAGK